jgi:hypothetical protein
MTADVNSNLKVQIAYVLAMDVSLSCFLPSDESHTGRVHRNVSTFFDCNGVSSSITSRVRRTCSLNDSND